ncbi:required for drug-induced death protein 1 isoform X2 [Antechinus flavipes]|uniref:required for drug-induced death protein 1 isoform X2 n=1 Tax=Antechinus flavipes TaxID=38775 RepID=UPI002236292D|nr:required for drug-induced death protein 1 isoform X2 [Antechinus flavipes]
MTVGARLRGKGDGRYRRRFPRWEQEEEEEEACILQHLHLEEEEGEREETEGQEEKPPQRAGIQGEAKGDKAPHSKKVHFAFLPERYETLEEQTTGEKPKKKYRKKLKKYGKVFVTPGLTIYLLNHLASSIMKLINNK